MNYGFIQRSHGITREGFPHSDICGSQAICASPQLFAAYRVLLRLLMPRHSPCALLSLNFFPSLLHEFRKSVIFLLIAVYCFQYYFALFFGKTIIFFTQFLLSFLLSCFSAFVYRSHGIPCARFAFSYFVVIVPSAVCLPIYLNNSLLRYIVIQPAFSRSPYLISDEVYPLSIAHCFWWAQVVSSHSPTYRAFILRISAVFVLSFAHFFFGGLKWIRVTLRRTAPLYFV